MVSVLTIILFFLYTWGLGFTVTYCVKQSENALERNLMNIGIGLGVFAILSIILNFFRAPLDWKTLLVLSLIIPIYDLYQKIKAGNLTLPKLKLTKSNLVVMVVLLIFFASFYMYAKGAFGYPYLEDEDPWGHAIGIKYVALEKDAYDPELKDVREMDPVLSYIDPYPPAYDVFMGILHQTSSNLNWTMKFFNALIISLGLIFFFFFAKQFIGDRNKALFATFVLAAIPCYLSHFIWAHALIITLFFPTMYAFERMRIDKRWFFITALMVAGIWVTQNISQPIKLSTLIILYLVISSITYRKVLYLQSAAFLSGILVSLFWWGAMVQKYGVKVFLSYYDGSYAQSDVIALVANKKWEFFGLIKKVLDPGGSGSRAYTFSDFFIAKSQNMINNPIGIGIIISILVLIGVIYVLWKYRSSIVKQKNTWLCITLFWLVFTFWGVNGMTFPFSIARASFRVWMLMAIPIALIASEGLYFLKALSKSRLIRFSIVFLVLLGIIFTSAQQKYEVNTAIWPTSGSFTPQEAAAYGEWFNTIPDNTNVFLYSPRDKLTIGYGKFSCAWCQDILDFRKEILYKDAEQLHQFLIEKDYQYFIINGRMETKYFNAIFGEEETNKLLQTRYNEIISSGLFVPVYQKENMFMVFKVK